MAGSLTFLGHQRPTGGLFFSEASFHLLHDLHHCCPHGAICHGHLVPRESHMWGSPIVSQGLRYQDVPEHPSCQQVSSKL